MALQFNRATKIATVPASDGTTITVQEIYDQFRDFEDEPRNLDLSTMIQAGGKDDLGTGQFTVVTATLLDGWRVAFEARPGPTTELMTITGGNLVGRDALDAVQFPVAPTAFTAVTMAQATTGALVGGSGGASAAEVWEYPAGAYVPGSYGELVGKKLLKFAQFLGLR